MYSLLTVPLFTEGYAVMHLAPPYTRIIANQDTQGATKSILADQ
jgi:hypothetical protein